MTAVAPALAQDVEQLTSPLTLPRAGYEPRTVRIGSLRLQPQLRLATVYDSNLFATDNDPTDDVVFTIEPRLLASIDGGKLRFNGRAYVDHRAYAQNTREDRTAGGIGGDGVFEISRNNQVQGSFALERLVESRTNPEARTGPFRSPTAIDRLQGGAGYRVELGRGSLGVRVAADRLNYRPVSESDRDLTSYTASLRGAVVLRRAELFAQPFVARRDFRNRVDRSGVNRDATTYGVLTGINLDLAAKWQGEIGIGGFRSDPRDPSLRGFSGLAASGRLTWYPRSRTALTLEVFQGDVATVRTGAQGRTDARIGLELNQEVRHNLLLQLRGGYTETRYRGLAGRNLRTTSAGGEVQYLFNRHVSAYANINYTERAAGSSIDRFDRALVGTGVRLAY